MAGCSHSCFVFLLSFFFPGAVSLTMSSIPKGLLKEMASCLIPAITFPRLVPQYYLISDACVGTCLMTSLK